MKFSVTKKHIPFLFLVGDIFLVAISSWFAFLLRFDGMVPADKATYLLVFCALALIVTIPVFISQGLYRMSWKYITFIDLFHIFMAMVLSMLIIGAVLFVMRDVKEFAGFPRSIFFLYGMLMFFFGGGLRFSKRIYWQIIKPRMGLAQFSGTVSHPANEPAVHHILVTGGAGYLGSELVRQLIAQEYEVTVFDKLLFSKDSLRELENNPLFHFIEGDILDSAALAQSLDGIDTVVNLAAIVGEPACASDKDRALQTNYLGAVHAAQICKASGIKHFIQASTCSTYGETEDDEMLTETSRLLPVDFYGETKIYAENELMKIADDRFAVTILRFSTLYGLSQRMRFDLVVNSFTKKAATQKEITVFGGDQWRPFLHVRDAARAIILVITMPRSQVANHIFNIGSSNENYTISQLAEIISQQMPGVSVKTIPNMNDKRNYRVSFDKAGKILGFTTTQRVPEGIREIRDAIATGELGDLEQKKYYNHLVNG